MAAAAALESREGARETDMREGYVFNGFFFAAGKSTLLRIRR
jgi:hypothetical protein